MYTVTVWYQVFWERASNGTIGASYVDSLREERLRMHGKPCFFAGDGKGRKDPSVIFSIPSVILGNGNGVRY